MNERIKQVRSVLGITQQEFADKIGVKRNSYANYETGRNTPIDAIVKSICREFNVNETWLRTGSGKMFQDPPSSELDALAEKYDLGSAARALIERFVTLKAEEQEIIIKFIQDAAATMNAAQPLPASTPSIDERLEIIRHQMELEEKAADESSVSRFAGINAADKVG